jgi:hypothetical protein
MSDCTITIELTPEAQMLVENLPIGPTPSNAFLDFLPGPVLSDPLISDLLQVVPIPSDNVCNIQPSIRPIIDPMSSAILGNIVPLIVGGRYRIGVHSQNNNLTITVIDGRECETIPKTSFKIVKIRC